MKADICVIGAGSGGLSVAAAAAQFGRKVVLIEKGEMGGDCLNFGCVPSKALIAAAHRAHAFENSTSFGIAAAKPKISAVGLKAHIDGVIAAIAPDDSEERFTALGCHVIRAAGRFTGPQAVEAGGEEIRARRFVIATGSQAFVPDIPGLSKVAFLTNETLFQLAEIPQHLLILGGGPIGLEMAQAFRRLGAKVTLVQRGPHVLTRDDPELAAIVQARLEAEGVRLCKNTKVIRAFKGPVLEIAGKDGVEKIAGTHLLIATGRRPNLAGLGLAEAGIAHTAQAITVDAGMRTTNPRVYAIGDVTGGLQFTHVANYQAGLVIRNALFRLPVRQKTSLLPRVTFTDPELAQVGLTEAEAAAQGLEVHVTRWPLHRNDRARAMREDDGLIKVISDKKGRILGAGMTGPHAGEWLSFWSLAVTQGMKLSQVAATIIAYPTLAEASRRAAMSHFAPLASNPWVRRLIGFLSIFG